MADKYDKTLGLLAEKLAVLPGAEMAKGMPAAGDDKPLDADAAAGIRDGLDDLVLKALGDYDPERDYSSDALSAQIAESAAIEPDPEEAAGDVLDSSGEPVDFDAIYKALMGETNALIALNHESTLTLAKALESGQAETERRLGRLEAMIAGLALRMLPGLAKAITPESYANAGRMPVDAGALYDMTAAPAGAAKGDPKLLEVSPGQVETLLNKALAAGKNVMDPAAAQAIFDNAASAYNLRGKDAALNILAGIDAATARALTGEGGA